MVRVVRPRGDRRAVTILRGIEAETGAEGGFGRGAPEKHNRLPADTVTDEAQVGEELGVDRPNLDSPRISLHLA